MIVKAPRHGNLNMTIDIMWGCCGVDPIRRDSCWKTRHGKTNQNSIKNIKILWRKKEDRKHNLYCEVDLVLIEFPLIEGSIVRESTSLKWDQSIFGEINGEWIESIGLLVMWASIWEIDSWIDVLIEAGTDMTDRLGSRCDWISREVNVADRPEADVTDRVDVIIDCSEINRLKSRSEESHRSKYSSLIHSICSTNSKAEMLACHCGLPIWVEHVDLCDSGIHVS